MFTSFKALFVVVAASLALVNAAIAPVPACQECGPGKSCQVDKTYGNAIPMQAEDGATTVSYTNDDDTFGVFLSKTQKQSPGAMQLGNVQRSTDTIMEIKWDDGKTQSWLAPAGEQCLVQSYPKGKSFDKVKTVSIYVRK